MTYYRIATALLSILTVKDQVQGSHAHTDDDNDGNLEAWSYIPATLPTALSDMAISVISISESGTVEDIGPGDGDVLTNTTQAVATNGNDVKKRIIITGGCDSQDGNTFVEEDWGEGFTCFSLSNKVRIIKCDVSLNNIGEEESNSQILPFYFHVNRLMLLILFVTISSKHGMVNSRHSLICHVHVIVMHLL